MGWGTSQPTQRRSKETSGYSSNKSLGNSSNQRPKMKASGRASDFDQNWYPVARAKLSQPPGQQASQAYRVSGETLNLLC